MQLIGRIGGGLAALLVLGSPIPAPAPAFDLVSEPVQDADDVVAALLAEGGVRFEPERGRFSIAARVATRDDLLEFLLVGPKGSAYESLFATEADPTLLNTAFLALGLEEGRNVRWVFADDGAEIAPAEGSRADAAGDWLGGREVRLEPPSGDGLLMYAGWTEGDEDFLFRIEDLLGNIESNAPLPRQRWTYIGSRFVESAKTGEEVFIAALEQNLVNIAWFPEGNTLVTATHPVCERQDVWVGNPWLVPEPNTPVRIFFSRDPMTTLPVDIREQLPDATAEGEESR
ncbi:MAG: YdjY domain-containing protein [Planctomycetota bacterium]